jgi:hypothetical protein
MSDRKALAREIAARSKAGFIDTNPAPVDRKALARAIAAQSVARFITIARERRGQVPFTAEQLTAMRGGLTVEQYLRKTIRKWGKR